jgi:hypothetical protein
VQIVSVAVFIAFPLRFSFPRPQSDGFFGALFVALGSFDKPFNQAPSLHIALLIVIWVRLAHHVRAGWRWVLHAWMALIGVSVLTTYQHHFIDVPTGLAVGFIALWALPDDDESPLRRWSWAADRARRRLALLYAAGAAGCAAVATIGGGWLWMFWPALALALVALNYAVIGARGFQKGPAGRLSLGARALLAPYLALAWLNSRLWTLRHPHAADVADGVSIGRVPGRGDFERSPFAGVVDLSAEMSFAHAGDRHYRSVAVLDLTVPSAGELREAVEAIETARAKGPVLVCCALGYSRSAAAVAAWLLTTRRASSVDEAMSMIRNARPSIVLKHEHAAVLKGFA